MENFKIDNSNNNNKNNSNKFLKTLYQNISNRIKKTVLKQNNIEPNNKSYNNNIEIKEKKKIYKHSLSQSDLTNYINDKSNSEIINKIFLRKNYKNNNENLIENINNNNKTIIVNKNNISNKQLVNNNSMKNLYNNNIYKNNILILKEEKNYNNSKKNYLFNNKNDLNSNNNSNTIENSNLNKNKVIFINYGDYIPKKKLILNHKQSMDDILRYSHALNNNNIKLNNNNNNIYNINTFSKNGSSNDLNKYEKEINFYKENKNIKSINLKIEDLILLIKKLDDIIYGIKDEENIFEGGISNECFEYLIFYCNSSLFEENFLFLNFKNNDNIIITSSINLLIFMIILSYDISYYPNYFQNFRLILNKNFLLLKINFFLLIETILSFLINNNNYNNKNEILMQKLNNIVNNNLKIINNNNNENNFDSISKINHNCREIVNNIKFILNQYKNNINNEFIKVFNILSKISLKNLSKFYFEKIFKIQNKNRSISYYSKYSNKIINEVIMHKNKSVPFIKEKLKKKFSLVLDLDETLINMKIKNNEINNYILHYRPYLQNFLYTLKSYFEIILFTSASNKYADPILNEIEKNHKYFDFKLYREHTIIINNEIIKNLNLLGRDLKKICIVDNISKNFQLNKDNGILIYPYYYENHKKDTALLELKKILLKIYNYFDDIREGIKYYKNDILMNVSCNIN